MQLENVYQLGASESGAFVARNGQPLVCPYFGYRTQPKKQESTLKVVATDPAPVNPMLQLEQVATPCGDHCALLDVQKKHGAKKATPNSYELVFGCTGHRVPLTLPEAQPNGEAAPPDNEPGQTEITPNTIADEPANKQ